MYLKLSTQQFLLTTLCYAATANIAAQDTDTQPLVRRSASLVTLTAHAIRTTQPTSLGSYRRPSPAQQLTHSLSNRGRLWAPVPPREQ